MCAVRNATAMLMTSTRAAARDASPTINSNPPPSSPHPDRTALNVGKGIPRPSKYWAVALTFMTFPHPAPINCQPQYSRTIRRNPSCKYVGARVYRS